MTSGDVADILLHPPPMSIESPILIELLLEEVEFISIPPISPMLIDILIRV